MTAPPVGVDRPVEAVAAAGDGVEGGLGADLVEVDPHRLRRVEGPDHGAVADAGQAQVVLDSLLIPPHTNICSHRVRMMSSPLRCWSRSLRACRSRAGSALWRGPWRAMARAGRPGG